MSSEFSEAIASQIIRPAIFVEANFTSGPIYVWSGIGTISWDGKDWLGLGSLGSISTIEEGSDIQAKGITLTLSGIDTSLLGGVLTEFQVGLPVLVYLGMFDADGDLIADPIVSWAGRTDQPTIEMDGTSATISINCENRLVEMNVSSERRYTNEDQRRDHPDDRGFEFVASIQEVVIYWGRSGGTNSPGSGGGGGGFIPLSPF
jgi:hypothetical protein